MAIFRKGGFMKKLFWILLPVFLLLFCSTPTSWAQKGKVYDLGHYPDGTNAKMLDLNDFGVAVGSGDTGISDPNGAGSFRPLGLSILDPKHWFDLGIFGGDETAALNGFGGECSEISNTGLIVGYALSPTAASQTYDFPHAFAWMPTLRSKVDLGLLSGDTCSEGFGVNKIGTLIVGISHKHSAELGSTLVDGIQSPIVWTPKAVWKRGGPSITWNIQKLPTGVLENEGAVVDGVTMNLWYAYTANDLGQIVGSLWDATWSYAVPIVWNPLRSGGWEIKRLDLAGYIPYGEALDINDKGEIVGYVTDENWIAFPALWKPDTQRKNWKLTVLTPLPGSPWSWASGINDLGDIVGTSYDESWNMLATSWNTRDLHSAQAIGFPGTWSDATKVNNLRIAVGRYGIGSGPEQAAAVRLP
jgi:uncharacterized membrane protein